MISNAVQLFENHKIRSAFNTETGEWVWSVVDVVGVLTESPDPAKYWRVLKTRLKADGIDVLPPPKEAGDSGFKQGCLTFH